MISYIKGPLIDILEDTVVVEAGNMGFNIRVPLSVLEELPAQGKEIVLYTYFQVREDAMSLYGFLNRQDLEMFKQLIGVNGIGPKGALGILSAMKPDALRLAILSGDAKAISKAPGVGVKTAQRIILDLKDRVSMAGLAAAEFSEPVSALEQGAAGEAVDALIALGYSETEAVRAVRKVEIREEATAEEVLKASLKHLAFL